MPILARVKSFFSSNSTPTTPPTSAAPVSAPATIAPTTLTPSAPPTLPAHEPASPMPTNISAFETTPPPVTEAPAFKADQVVVVFVLGGPGAGKGTQCARLVADLGFVHLSAGDLLRAEQNRPDSSYGAMIKEHIKEGIIVPMEVTIKLLENAMRESLDNKEVKDGKPSLFLIDGFPRQMDQAIKFDESVCPSSLVLFLTCPEEVLLQRLLERGKTSGRDDDNAESIKKRFATFINTSMPVVEYYRKLNKVVEIDSSQTVDQVYEVIHKAIETVLPAEAEVAA